MANPLIGLGAGTLLRQGALRYAPTVMRSLGIGARALPQVTAKLLPRVASGGGRALIPRVAGNVATAGRAGVPAVRASGHMSKYFTGGQVPGSIFNQGTRNLFAGAAATGGAGMITGAVSPVIDEITGDKSFDVGPSIMDNYKTPNGMYDKSGNVVNPNGIPNGPGPGGNPAESLEADDYVDGADYDKWADDFTDADIVKTTTAPGKTKSTKKPMKAKPGPKKPGPAKGSKNVAPSAPVKNPYSKNPFSKNFSPSAFVDGAGNAKVDAKHIPGSKAYEAKRSAALRKVAITKSKKKPTHSDRLAMLDSDSDGVNW